MATRCSFENSNEIGVFAALTNSYCLAGEYLHSDGSRRLAIVPVF
jgi:translation initiation factor 6 (eIF-6)